jgi:DNA-binding MarR family transcriptional regulator
VNNKGRGAPVDLMAILHLAHAAENELEGKLNGIGLTLTKLLALRLLAEAGEPLPLGQLADRLSCVKSNITQIVDRLEADGLVARKPDPGDRRTRLAALTATGRRLCQEATRMQQDTERELAGRLTREEAQSLGALLTKMRAPSE